MAVGGENRCPPVGSADGRGWSQFKRRTRGGGQVSTGVDRHPNSVAPDLGVNYLGCRLIPLNVFVGREAELARLERELAGVRRTGGGALLSVRGRRRVGKSRLVEELIQRSGCASVFLHRGTGAGPPGRALPGDDRALRCPGCRGRARRCERRVVGGRAGPRRSGATTKAPVIIVIDELPTSSPEPTIEAVLQLLWDRTFQRQAVLVILVGSDRATMEALTEEGRPLYDRAREMVVKPLAPSTIAEMLDLPARHWTPTRSSAASGRARMGPRPLAG